MYLIRCRHDVINVWRHVVQLLYLDSILLSQCNVVVVVKSELTVQIPSGEFRLWKPYCKIRLRLLTYGTVRVACNFLRFGHFYAWDLWFTLHSQAVICAKVFEVQEESILASDRSVNVVSRMYASDVAFDHRRLNILLKILVRLQQNTPSHAFTNRPQTTIFFDSYIQEEHLIVY